MLKQALKVPTKVDFSLSILKEAKNTFTASLQWPSRRLISTSSKSKWDLLSAVCLERHPIITKPMNDIEKSYYELLKRIEYENSMKSDHELRLEKDRQQRELSKSNISDIDVVTLQTAQEFEDSNVEELRKFQFAPRLTEFDKSNDKTSHMRMLDKTLVLLIEQKINNVATWIPPQGLRKDGETMRQAAERVLQEFCGTNMTVKFYGNAPIGFHKYRYAEQNKESNKCGAKIFYFLAKRVDGSIANNIKHQWLNKEELKKTMPYPFYQHVSEFLIFE